MGFDFGMTKIGIAVGQRITGTASPIAIIRARDGIPDWNEVKKLLDEWQPDQCVVGKPLNMDGSESPMSALAEKFARRLHGRFNLPAVTFDERLTSREAESLASDSDAPVDSIAATLILESWFRETQAR